MNVAHIVENKLMCFGHEQTTHINVVVRRINQMKDSHVKQGRGKT